MLSRYDVPPGTWLEKKGFAGQEMFWSIFYFPKDGKQFSCRVAGALTRERSPSLARSGPLVQKTMSVDDEEVLVVII